MRGKVLLRPNGEAPYPLLFGQLAVGPGNNLLGCVGVVQNQGRVHLNRRAPRKPYHGRIRNVRVFRQHRLDVFREDILAAGEYDHILFPALDVQEPLVVEEA